MRIAGMNLSLKTHVLWRQLGQAVRVSDILVDKEAAPTSFDGIEMLPVKGNAWADDLHVASAVVAQRLAGQNGMPCLLSSTTSCSSRKSFNSTSGVNLKPSGPTTLSKKYSSAFFLDSVSIQHLLTIPAHSYTVPADSPR